MQRQQSALRSMQFDTSIGYSNALYQNGSFNTNNKSDLIDQNLESNIYLFLSIVHSNSTLTNLFNSRCKNKDKFLYLNDHKQYEQLLIQVLQIFNEYLMSNPNKSNKLSDQVYYSPKTSNNQVCKLQGMIKQIVTKELDPLKNMIQQTQEQTDYWSKELKQSKSSTLIQSQSFQHKPPQRAGVEELKQKIQNLAIQQNISLQCRMIKTEQSAKKENNQISKNQFLKCSVLDDKQQYETNDFQQEQQQYQQQQQQYKQNRISFGQQNFNQSSQKSNKNIQQQDGDTIQQDLKVNVKQHNFLKGTLHSNKFSGSPTFLDEKLDSECQTEQILNSVNDINENPQKESNCKQNKVSVKKKSPRSPNVASNRNNYEQRNLSIDQQDKRKKNSVNQRNFNILTNETISQ